LFNLFQTPQQNGHVADDTYDDPSNGLACEDDDTDLGNGMLVK